MVINNPKESKLVTLLVGLVAWGMVLWIVLVLASGCQIHMLGTYYTGQTGETTLLETKHEVVTGQENDNRDDRSGDSDDSVRVGPFDE